MKKKKLLSKISGTLTTIGFCLSFPGLALARDIEVQPGNGFEQLSNITPASLVSGAIKLILVAAALLFFFMLVVGGIQWIVSGGDKAASENARKRITSALVGLAIVFVAWAIVGLIATLFGINILSLNIPNFYNGTGAPAATATPAPR